MGKTGKIILLVIGSILGCIAIIIGLVFWGSMGVKDAAEEILVQLHAGKAQQVYEKSALATAMSYVQFNQAMGVGTDIDITKAELVRWEGRGFENSEKYIYGVFRFADNTENYLTFRFEEVGEETILLGITGGQPEQSPEPLEPMDDF